MGIKLTSGSLRAVAILRELIVSGILRPLESIDVSIVCERFQLDRREVDDAVATLEREGLVSFEGRGPVVRKISDEELVAWLAKRRTLEPAVAEKLALVIDESGVAFLSRHIDEQRAAVEQEQVILFLDLTAQFHCELARLAGFTMAAHWLELARDRLMISGVRALPNKSKLFECYSEHRELVELLTARKAVDARNSMIRHLDKTAERLSLGECVIE